MENFSKNDQLQYKLKVQNYLLSSKYQFKPFGSSQPRFSYQNQHIKQQRNTIDFNQMISIKDQHIVSKRQAFLETIKLHKKQANTHQNAIFASTLSRFDSPQNRSVRMQNMNQSYFQTIAEESENYRRRVQMNQKLKYDNIKSDKRIDGMTQSTFGLSYLQRDNNQEPNHYEINQSLFKKRNYFSKENPKLGFNSTNQRFLYMKEMQKMGETPGPGSYEKDLITTNQSSMAHQTSVRSTFKQSLNTISSTGGGFINQQSDSGLMPTNRSKSPPFNQNQQYKMARNGSSFFQNQTSRQDFAHYIPQNSNNNNALQNLGPGSYFQGKSPFLKKSYNVSLPPIRYY